MPAALASPTQQPIGDRSPKVNRAGIAASNVLVRGLGSQVEFQSAYHSATGPWPKTSTAQSTYSREATATAPPASGCNDDRLRLRSLLSDADRG
jgi:hypothetical protein